MNNKNFAGQKLDGRSFSGQDLQGADFSGCSLKSCDFRDSDLTGANFCNAVFGVSVWREYCKNIFVFFGVVFLTFVSVGFNFFLVMVLAGKSGNVLIWAANILIFLGSVVALGWGAVVYLSLKFRRPLLIAHYGLLIGVILIILQSMMDVTSIVFVLPALAVVVGVFGVAIAVSIAGSGGAILTLLILTMLATVSFGEVYKFSEAGLAAMSVISTILISIVVGIYVRNQSLVMENSLLAWHRRISLIWQGWGGTNFSGAKLMHVNFGLANIKNANFVDAILVRSNFLHVVNFHLARTEKTSFSPKKVRVLVSGEEIFRGDRDLSRLDLRALSFAGLNLSEANFQKTDLSDADFSACDLRGADFSEATVLGTNFERAQLTGATIDQWNTDKRTRFDGVDCEYVYTKRDKSFKNPPQGTFKAGEFSKLYQEIANTVDFIVHTPEELQALLRAIESIKQQGGEIVIQSLERKNESVVVRTQSPEAIDKAAIYAQVREEMDSQFQLLKSEYEQQFLAQNLAQKFELVESKARHDETRKTMDSLIIGLLNQPSNIIVNDHSRTISNSTLTNSATNLGDHSTVSNNVIEQVADAQLRTDLQKLHDLLAHSTLPAYEKKQAQESVTELAQASDKPAAERKSIARRSLTFLKDLHKDLGSMADLGVQYGETLARVVLWFQGL